MSVSDQDFIDFYQQALCYLWLEGSDHMLWLATCTDENNDKNWHNKLLTALARLVLSGLVEGGVVQVGENFNHDWNTIEELDIIAKETDEIKWIDHYFDLTQAGVELIKPFGVRSSPGVLDDMELIPGLREALSRVFDEHGVGFDVELPYKSCITSD